MSVVRLVSRCVLVVLVAGLSLSSLMGSVQVDEKGRVDMFSRPATDAELKTLGSVWDIVECCGWTGKWTRRPGTNTFDARWTGNGMIATDTLTLQGWDKRTNRIVLHRTNNNGTYWGVLNPANGTITNGGTSWYPAGATWSATLFAAPSDEKGPVQLQIRR